MAKEILNWIQNWYNSQCNGDWEHSYGIKIETLDNPGWNIEIDLEDTNLATYEYESEVIEKSKEDWYYYKFKDAKFKASGDCSKLGYLLEIFKTEVEKRGY